MDKKMTQKVIYILHAVLNIVHGKNYSRRHLLNKSVIFFCRWDVSYHKAPKFSALQVVRYVQYVLYVRTNVRYCTVSVKYSQITGKIQSSHTVRPQLTLNQQNTTKLHNLLAYFLWSLCSSVALSTESFIIHNGEWRIDRNASGER
jgi:hypothetical protein